MKRPVASVLQSRFATSASVYVCFAELPLTVVAVKSYVPGKWQAWQLLSALGKPTSP